MPPLKITSDSQSLRLSTHFLFLSVHPMYAKSQVTLWSVAIFSVAIMAATTPTARAAVITWIGGNVDWVDGGATANWTPADEPDNDDDAIFNTGNTVNLGSNNIVN